MNIESEIQQLVSYVSGNCSLDEQKSVDNWIKLSKDNEMLYADYKKIWESTKVNKQSILIDVDSRWEDFKLRSNFEEKAEIEQRFTLKRFLLNASKVAAAVVLMFSVWMMFDKEEVAETIYYTAESTQLDSPYMLPDGSEVVLSNNSNLSYPENFASDARNVGFRGKAFFDIAHNPEKPLIISTDNVRVKVLGTSFNLCNNEGSDEITVYLETGKVLFYSVDLESGNTLEQTILVPGEKGVYNKLTGNISKTIYTDENHKAWKTGILDFVNAPLTDVIPVLESNFDIKVNSKVSLSEYRLTARFEQETTESVFETLQTIYGFEYEIDKNIVSIR